MSGVYIKGLNIEPRDDGFDGKGLVIIGYDDKLYLVTHEQIIPLPDHGDLIDRDVVVARLAEWSKKLIETYGENDEYVNCLSEVLEGLGCDDVIIPAERSTDG